MVAVSPSPPPAPRDVKFLCVSPPWWTVARDYPPRVLRPAKAKFFVIFPLTPPATFCPPLSSDGWGSPVAQIAGTSCACRRGIACRHSSISDKPPSPPPENNNSLPARLPSAFPQYAAGAAARRFQRPGRADHSTSLKWCGDAAVLCVMRSRRVRWASRPGNRRSAAEGTPTDLPSERPAGMCPMCTPPTDRCWEQSPEIGIRTPV